MQQYCLTQLSNLHGRPPDFFRGGQWGGLKDGSLPAASRGSSRWGLGAKPFKLTLSQNDADTSFTEVSDNICIKTLFNISRGGAQVQVRPPLTMPTGAHANLHVAYSNVYA